jgi:hypothetical protein
MVSFTPGRFIPRERAPGTHWIGGWVDPSAVLDAVVKRKIPSPRQEPLPLSQVFESYAPHTDLREIRWEGVDWVLLTQYRDQLQALVACIKDEFLGC